MIARIAPLRRLPRGLGAFDYLIPSTMSLVPGSIVQIHFRTSKTAGVVLELAASSEIPSKRLLAVERLLCKQAYVPAHVLDIAHYVSKEGFASIATTLRGMLPVLPVRRTVEILTDRSAGMSNDLRRAIDREVGSSHAVSIVTYLYEATKLDFYRNVIRLAQRSETSSLLIVPTIARAQRYAAAIPGSTFYHHGGSATELRRTYETIRNARSMSVIGTRSAMFAPLNNPGLILIDDEEADEHIQDEPNPRYDIRAVAAKLSQSAHVKVVLTSRLPSLVTASHYPLSRMLDEPEQTKCETVNLDVERMHGDYRIIPQQTRSRIAAAIAHNERVIVVHHRSGSFGSLECRDCGFTFTCPTCGVPLRLDGDMLICRHCNESTAPPARCPRCRSVTLRGRGRGASLLVRELASLPGARIAVGDEHADRDDANILITTLHSAGELSRRSYRLAIVTRYDSILSLPRVDADELGRRLLRTLAGSLSPRRGTLIIQASGNATAACRELFDDAWQASTLKERERFGYPPAWRLFLLRRRTTSRSRSTPAHDLVSDLRRADSSAVVDGPLRSYGRSGVDSGGSLVLLRTRRRLTPAVRGILERLDEAWSISVDPREIN